MGSHPINLAVRFFLEVAALAAMGFWGWKQGAGVLRFVLALAIPLIAAVVWGTFAVPHDPSRSGQALIPVPGMLRLALEVLFFTCALWALSNSGATTPSWILGSVILVHYALSYDRVFWLFNQ